ncbi:hypothetical protein A1QO_00805 [Vibrio genomosp. F10 str. ZF-129]|uniref:Tyr recombinase domain-containing protein n=1 Tax=Vibrio genomosp. F10 str. ZF-129 TaxID=1187848 RepID=A0A1E5BGD9_9VIBR|nr:tyrosine-type recombinase/integrase [Vibrio genomosp. F10]OEE35332.1 hypothetical protein A1QO_00805 [Vibrio genomosp. F10 str. ZF-129]
MNDLANLSKSVSVFEDHFQKRLAEIELHDANPNDVDDETATVKLRVWLESYKRNSAPNTYRAYMGAWERYVSACTAVGVNWLPITASNIIKVLHYLEVNRKQKLSTLRLTCSMVNNFHDAAGYPKPTLNKQVQSELKGIRRRLKVASKQAPALTEVHKDQIIQTYLKEGSIRSIRDACMVSVMFDSLLRRSEVANIRMQDIHERSFPLGTSDKPDRQLPMPFPYRSNERLDGRLHIPSSKTDQDGHGANGYLSPDSIRLISFMVDKCGLDVRDSDSFLFRGIDNSGNLGERISDQGVYRAMQKMSEVIGTKFKFTGHSCRVGACILISKTSSTAEVMKAGRWRSPAMPAYYTRNEEVYEGAMAKYHKHRDEPNFINLQN